MPFNSIIRAKKLSAAAVTAGHKQYAGATNRFEVQAKGEDEFTMYLSGAVGASYWDEEGITEKEVRDAIDSVPKGKKITFHVNSEGGSVMEGIGIYNKIKSRASDITCRVSCAYSIASVFPLAAGKVISPKSSMWMIHKAWNYAAGNADEMRKNAEMLDQHDNLLADIYAAETGGSKADWLKNMEKETWATGSQAMEYGLADETGEEDDEELTEASARIHPEFLARCKNLSPEVLNMLKPKENKLPANSMATKDNDMNKTKVVATLKRHGIDANENETESELQAKLDKIPVHTPTDVQGADKVLSNQATQIAALATQLAQAKRERVEEKIDALISAQQLTNEEREDAVTRAVADETYLKVLAKRPVIASGQPGIGHVTIVSENVLDRIKKDHKTPSARYAAMKKEDWKGMFDDACARDRRNGKEVLAANTYSSTLVTSFLMDGSVTDLQNRWAMLASFSIDTSPDQYKPLATGVLKHVTAGGTVQTDATNFESGNSTVAPVSVTMHQYSVAFQVSNSDLNSGLRMQDLVTINTANFANKVIEVATAPLTVANFANPYVSAPASFGFSDSAALQGRLKKSPIMNVILDGEYIANLTNNPGYFQIGPTVNGTSAQMRPYGWDGMYLNTDWTGAAANVRGFACNPQAVAGILGLPLTPPNIPGGIFQTSTMVVPGLDTSVMTSSWFNTSTRTMWSGLDIMAGFNAVDTTAGILITSQ